MSNDDLDLPSLMRVVDAATPGEWYVDIDNGELATSISDGVKLARGEWADEPTVQDYANTKFLSTFDPPTVRRLLERIAAAEGDVREERAHRRQTMEALAEASDTNDEFRRQLAAANERIAVLESRERALVTAVDDAQLANAEAEAFLMGLRRITGNDRLDQMAQRLHYARLAVYDALDAATAPESAEEVQG